MVQKDLELSYFGRTLVLSRLFQKDLGALYFAFEKDLGLSCFRRTLVPSSLFRKNLGAFYVALQKVLPKNELATLLST